MYIFVATRLVLPDYVSLGQISIYNYVKLASLIFNISGNNIYVGGHEEKTKMPGRIYT